MKIQRRNWIAYQRRHLIIVLNSKIQSPINFRFWVDGFFTAVCTHCGKPSYWDKQKMIYPATVTAPFPNPDIPDGIKADFEEARQIANSSPRGAAALLRLVIQKLCVYPGEPGRFK